ncbi:type IV secretory system conjugative DNA transfer family protein [Microvirgula aerodenitrificans]|uniref:type IV secretory system conjugative DNA transfer family protein n=1 Tax=Microvirgula aerodenitrificans TaxID=57480 RepID=UPI00248E59ED|nr:type IV secretory system conjugative DNA transfer family protein [Microvirgula aerodenitrificans]
MQNWLKWLFGVVMFITATIGAVWLAGFLFFAFSKANPFGKTDFSTWWTYWHFYQADLVIAKRLKVSAIVAAVVAYGAPVVALIVAMREVRSLHGEARFATTGEIAKAGLFGNTGIIIGKWKNRFLMFAGMQFVLLAAPTRSGKGVGIVIPNLLNYNESAVVLDVKLENFLITSKFRAKYGQEVFLFNPFSKNGQTHRYNPLGYISDDPRQRVTEILAIGYALYPGAGKDAFFDDAARNLFLGLSLYLCETPTLPRTIGELLRQSSGKGQPVKAYLQGLITERNYREFGDVMLNDPGDNLGTVVQAIAAIRGCSNAEAEELCSAVPVAVAENVCKAELKRIETLLSEAGAEYETSRWQVPLTVWDGQGLPMLSMECVDALNRFTSTSDNTLSSILASFNVPLTIWVSPLVDAATAANDFDLRDVRKKCMTIYIGIPANKLAEAELLINLFFSQLVNLNTDDLLFSKPELKYTCLMLMDEFAAPGRIGIIDKANSYMAGFGLRMLTIIQSPGQIEEEPRKGYGRASARTLMTNHACQIVYTPREQRDANEYSEMLGYDTVHSRGKNYGRGGTGHSEQIGEGAGQKRALMLPQELKKMSQRQQIISLENTPPIKCEKIAYFRDHVFINRLKAVSPSLAALGKKLPTKKQLEDAWSSGECAVNIPYLDLDLHEAIVQSRTRELNSADVAAGIDLHTLAIDFSKVPVPEDDGIAPEQVEAFVAGFFDALDAVNDYDDAPDSDVDGASERPSDAELAALDAQTADDDQAAAPDHDHADMEPTGPTDSELAAMMDEIASLDDMPIDEADMMAALYEMEAKPALDEFAESDPPILDLSVLEKPYSPTRDEARN